MSSSQQQQQTNLRTKAPQKLGNAQTTERMGGSMEADGKTVRYTSYGGKPTTSLAKPSKKPVKTPSKKPTKVSPKNIYKPSKQPTYSQIAKSVSKSMGY